MEQHRAVTVDVFKICPKCDTAWQNRENFLQDPSVELAGYQVNFKDLKAGLFLFNHVSCETTLSVRAEFFLDLYKGPIFRERKHGTDDCPKYCLYENNVMTCPAQCECSYVRVVLNKISKMKERATAIL
jgi:hypothetical protein